MKNKYKKYAISMGVATVLAAPIIATISCSKDNNNTDTTKTTDNTTKVTNNNIRKTYIEENSFYSGVILALAGLSESEEDKAKVNEILKYINLPEQKLFTEGLKAISNPDSFSVETPELLEYLKPILENMNLSLNDIKEVIIPILKKGLASIIPSAIPQILESVMNDEFLMNKMANAFGVSDSNGVAIMDKKIEGKYMLELFDSILPYLKGEINDEAIVKIVNTLLKKIDINELSDVSEVLTEDILKAIMDLIGSSEEVTLPENINYSNLLTIIKSLEKTQIQPILEIVFDEEGKVDVVAILKSLIDPLKNIELTLGNLKDDIMPIISSFVNSSFVDTLIQTMFNDKDIITFIAKQYGVLNMETNTIDYNKIIDANALSESMRMISSTYESLLDLYNNAKNVLLDSNAQEAFSSVLEKLNDLKSEHSSNINDAQVAQTILSEWELEKQKILEEKGATEKYQSFDNSLKNTIQNVADTFRSFGFNEVSELNSLMTNVISKLVNELASSLGQNGAALGALGSLINPIMQQLQTLTLDSFVLFLFTSKRDYNIFNRVDGTQFASEGAFPIIELMLQFKIFG